MSTDTTSWSPAAVAARAAATTPPVGPEPMVATARLPITAGGAQPNLEAVEVAHDRRADVGVDERGRRSRELWWLRVHLVGERHQLDVGKLLEDQLAGAQLVRGVQVRMQERY